MNYFRCTYFLFFLFLNASGSLQAQSDKTDTAKKLLYGVDASDSGYIKNCFLTADAYMNTEQYDSAQLWLNKIHEKIPAKKSSLFNYFLTTRQAEVYYYNNLQQLGLQESFKGLSMAKELNDSLLLADSYNFLGLFYMNLDSSNEAIPFYRNGLRFTRQPPYPLQYFSLTKPHHLFSNLAIAYYNLKRYDSALVNIRQSLQKAYEINWQRGIAIGHKGSGDIFLALGKTDSALLHYQKGKNTAMASHDIDVELVCYGGYAQCLSESGNNNLSKALLDSGFGILSKYPTLNRYFAFQFLNTAIDIYKKQQATAQLATALEIKSDLETANLKSSNTQIQTILKAGVENEKRVLSLEVTEAQQQQDLANTRLLIALTAFALLAVGFLWYRHSQKQTIRLANIRNKISQDLHDDIGASLSSLQIYGTIAEQSIREKPEKAIEMIQKISAQSTRLMENMSDIVWSMQPSAEDTISLEAKIKNFGSDLLADKQIHFSYQISADAAASLTGIQARKNILLLIKEAMNNIAKYSGAANASVTLTTENKNLLLVISDDGSGFDNSGTITGNGLKNMERRVKELNGNFCIQTAAGKGTVIRALVPLQNVL